MIQLLKVYGVSKIETTWKSDIASGLSLTSGILILAGAVIPWIWHASFYPQMSWMMGTPNAMPIFAGMIVIGAVSGATIVLSSIMMSSRPSESSRWGVIVLVFSVLSFFGMGGFLIGAVLGIVGGILAIAKR